MDIGYFVCSTLRCDSKHFSSAAERVIDDTHQFPPGVVESSCSEGSYNSEQPSSSSIDALSASRKHLQSGHISPSSLALQRRLPQGPVYLKQQTLSTDSTTVSGESITCKWSSSTSSLSHKKNPDMAIARPVTPSRNKPSQVVVTEFENRLDKHSNEVDIGDDSFENEEKFKQDYHPEVDFETFCLNPPPLRSKAWSEPSAEQYNVRSKGYMSNGIKELSEKSAFRLITVDLINTKTPIYTGMCSHPGERIQLALEQERKTGIRELPEFVFAINLCLPGETIYHAVFYYGIDKTTLDEIKQGRTAFGRIMKKFIFGNSDSYRNKTFKLIPRIVEGNYMVRKGVGSRPAVMGKKIKQYFMRGGAVNGEGDDRYFEIIVDIASDPIAKRITKLCLGFIKTIVVDMMFALEGYDESTLPERIFGGATIRNIDFARMDGKRSVR